MEVEVKLRLPNIEAYSRFLRALAYPNLAKFPALAVGAAAQTAVAAAAATARFEGEDLQQNYFIDGTSGELSSQRAVLRIRRCLDPLTKMPNKFYFTLKARSRLENGVSRAQELEHDLTAAQAASLLAGVDADAAAAPTRQNPIAVTEALRKVAADGNPIAAHVLREFPAGGYHIMGGFETIRRRFAWQPPSLQQSQLLEVDQTRYQFGEAYEIEAETPDPEPVRAALVSFLTQLGIPHGDSQRSKFSNYLSGSIA